MAVRRVPYGLQNPMQGAGGYQPAANRFGRPNPTKPPPAPAAPRAPGTGGTNAAPPAGGSLASLGVPAASGGPPPIDPRDATYWQDVVALNYSTEGGIQGLENQITNAGIARTRALEDLSKGHNQAGKDLRESMAGRGLGVSTTSAQGFADQEANYATAQNRQNESYNTFVGQAKGQEDLLRRQQVDSEAAAQRAAAERTAANAPKQYAATPYLSASSPSQVAGTYKLTSQQRISLSNALRKAKTPAEKQIISEKLYGFRPY